MKKYMSIALLAGALVMSGCGDSENFVFTNTNNNVPLAAPVCADDAYATNQNQALTVSAANGVLANDQPNGGTVAFSATSTQGGTVAGDASGGFTYTPAPSFNGIDTFSYTVTNASGQATCTVTITVISTNGFFVDAANGNDATGSFQDGNPFATIQAAVTAAGTNQDIIVLPGTYNENVTLLDGQRLLGSGSVLAQGTPVRPIINGGGITLADGNTVDYIRIQNTPGDAIFGNGVNGATITNCEIADTTNNGSGIQDDNATGTWTVEGNAITSVASIGVFLNGDTGDALVAMVNNNNITGSGNGAMAFVYQGTGTARVQVIGNTMTGTVIPGQTFAVEAANQAELCFDITGNTNDDAYAFAALNTSEIEVEQLNDLLILNSGSATVDNPSAGIASPAVQVPDNHCMFGN